MDVHCEIDWRALFVPAVEAVAEGRAKEMEARLLHALCVAQRDGTPGAKWIDKVTALAALYFATNKIEGAKLLIKSALSKTEQLHGVHHLEASNALCILGEVYLEKKQYHRIGPLVMHTTINLRKHFNSRHAASRLHALEAESQSIYQQAAQ